jgi:hypothetical protein
MFLGFIFLGVLFSSGWSEQWQMRGSFAALRMTTKASNDNGNYNGATATTTTTTTATPTATADPYGMTTKGQTKATTEGGVLIGFGVSGI